MSVVTPVYNGADHLRECIESVLAQTYGHWEYVIVDNCSVDQTAELARQYAEQDARIRVSTNERFLDIIPNWNHALGQISPESAYCKVLHGDDVMTPDCLERMVDLAERHPSAAIVSAYRLSGTDVDLDGVIPWGTEVLPGSEVCRRTLLGDGYVFGSPSSLLIRSDLIRARERFYNEENLHADTEICFELLENADFGFVHQVLTYTRRHPGAMTTTAARVGTRTAAWLRVLFVYGPKYLTEEEYGRRLAWWLRRYAWQLSKALVRGRLQDPLFRKHHASTLGMLRRSLRIRDVVRGLLP